MKNIVYILLLLLTSCSTTSHLPEEEILYTGMRKTVVEERDISDAGNTALTEAKAALSMAPNGSILGSTSLRSPLPVGLWTYNAFCSYKKGIGHWIFDRFSVNPIFISAVNPEVRVKVAQNVLRNHGYFRANVGYELLPTKKRQAKLRYTIKMNEPYRLDTIIYADYNHYTDSLIKQKEGEIFHIGDNFNVANLERKRQQLNSFLRNAGYYYFRPDWVHFLADTTSKVGRVSLKVIPKAGLPLQVLTPWKVGSRSISLYGYNGEEPTDSIYYKDLLIRYQGKLKVRPPVLYDRIFMIPGENYSQKKQLKTQEEFSRLGIFKYSEMKFMPSTELGKQILNMNMKTGYELPYDGELELNMNLKSSGQLGPGLLYTVSKRNIFGGGETFSVELKGSYEWQTNSVVDGAKSVINSYELGLSTSLGAPRIALPWRKFRALTYPSKTTFSLYVNQLSRAHFFKLLSFGGNVSYNFQSSATSKHTVIPFKLTFNYLQRTTLHFDTIMMNNPALYESLQNQFVPSMSYTYTYDDASIKSKRNHFWWETSFTSAGNITSAIYRVFGKSFNEEKTLFGNPFAQFLKFSSEIRYNYRINERQSIATRFIGGVLYAYGNSSVAPYNEQFFIGGANSLRGFTVRSLGPGGYKPTTVSNYSYMDQTGNFKLEANVEYRFNILKKLNGALFVDAGNIWLLSPDTARPEGQFSFSRLAKDIAVDVGCGLRYDLSFLVIRVDAGFALHVPYVTSKPGYFNIPSLKDGMGIHLALGYPF